MKKCQLIKILGIYTVRQFQNANNVNEQNSNTGVVHLNIWSTYESETITVVKNDSRWFLVLHFPNFSSVYLLLHDLFAKSYKDI